jgi:hypothetical protein
LFLVFTELPMAPGLHDFSTSPSADYSKVLMLRDQAGINEVSGQDFVMFERAYAPDFHDLIVGMLRDFPVFR